MAVERLKVDLRPKLGKLTITSKKDIAGRLTGSMSTERKGVGLEFSGFRVYNPNQDDAKAIDWKASLRTVNQTLVRELIAEKNVSVFIIIDASNSMLFSSTGKMKCEFAIEVATTIAFTIIQGGNSCGVSLFSDKIITTIEPNLGAGQYGKIVRELTKPEFYGGPKNLAHVLREFGLTMQSEKALILLMTDFLGTNNEEWKDHVKMLALKYDMIPIMVLDPLDRKMPDLDTQIVFSDPFSGEEMVVNPKLVKSGYERNAKIHELHIEKMFKDFGVKLLTLQTDQNFAVPLMNYMNMRSGS
jgi:uncharacterized protein (DUF58 family)